FAADRKILLVDPDTTFVFSAPPIAFAVGYFIAGTFHYGSDFYGWIIITAIALPLTFILVAKEFLWLHFLPDKIIVRHPLVMHTKEIPITAIEAAGYKVVYKGSHYFIKTKKESRKGYISFTSFLIESERQILADYFTSRGIEFQDL
ncbi:MAG TPA: hypothetical protein VK174_03970, partial [Chitinophagales bacterium]|nr:hypothetical protein [Chitinophagales bacterium]